LKIISEPPLAFQFDGRQWIPIIPKDNFVRDDFEETVKSFEKNLSLKDEIRFLGLPKVGKSTYLMNLLKSLSDLSGKTVFFIPNQNFSANDYAQIKETEIYRKSLKNQSIIGLDNSNINLEYQNIFLNSKICIVPKFFGEVYASEYIKPLNIDETFRLISNFTNIELSKTVIKTIVSYSAGIPSLIEPLLKYFVFYKNLSIKSLITDHEISIYLDSIFNDFMSQIRDETKKLMVALVALGKSIDSFFSSIQNNVRNADITLLSQLGFDNVLASPLLLEYFRQKIGREALSDFKKNTVKEFVSSQNNNLLGIWTADNELKFFPKTSKIEDVASNLFKSKTLFHRIDWDKSLLNNKPVSKQNTINFGDEINFILGKRNEEKLRNKEYKKLNKKYKKLILIADSLSKKGNFEDAKKGYEGNFEDAKKGYEGIQNLKYDNGDRFTPDSNYAKVRLANMYRIQGNLEKAIEICKPIIRSTPNPFACLCIGICQFWKGNFTLALEYFEKSLQYKPDYINASLWKVRVLIHLKEEFEIESLLLSLKEKDRSMNNETKLLFLLLNYTFYFSKKEFPDRTKQSIWRNKTLAFISLYKAEIQRHLIPLIILFLELQADKQNLIEEIRQMSLNDILAEGVEIDLYWWRVILFI